MHTYFFSVYRDARILDVFRRLEANDVVLFLPHDAEMTLGELKLVLHKSERYRGPRGGRRRAVVTDLKVRHEKGESLLTHVAIYCVNGPLEGLPVTLHRHFLRLGDGTVIEVLGDELQYIQPEPVVDAVRKLVETNVLPTPAQTPPATTPRLSPGLGSPDVSTVGSHHDDGRPSKFLGDDEQKRFVGGISELSQGPKFAKAVPGGKQFGTPRFEGGGKPAGAMGLGGMASPTGGVRAPTSS